MAAALLFDPNPQFCDQDGHPYAGGTIATYTPGTSTPKATWIEHTGTTLQTNPIVLDAAGRCLMFGDGDYRLVLSDAAGNLVFDQWSSTIVSAAMQPVVSAPTIADAVNLLGIDALIAAEASARSAADSAEQSARIAADNAEATARANADTAETARAEAAENALTTNLNAEIARAEAAEAALAAEIASSGGDLSTSRTVSTTTDALGNFSVTWTPAFSTAIKLNSNGSPAIFVDGPLAVQAGAVFTGVTIMLNSCSGLLSFTDGQTPATIPGTPFASTAFTFKVEGW